jgi:hypothetical protein
MRDRLEMTRQSIEEMPAEPGQIVIDPKENHSNVTQHLGQTDPNAIPLWTK